jgi:hypothetical protein
LLYPGRMARLNQPADEQKVGRTVLSFLFA